MFLFAYPSSFPPGLSVRFSSLELVSEFWLVGVVRLGSSHLEYSDYGRLL